MSVRCEEMREVTIGREGAPESRGTRCLEGEDPAGGSGEVRRGVSPGAGCNPAWCRYTLLEFLGMNLGGGVWLSLLGGNGALVRICPRTMKRTLVKLPRPAWLHSMRFIHVRRTQTPG